MKPKYRIIFRRLTNEYIIVPIKNGFIDYNSKWYPFPYTGNLKEK